MDNLTEVIQKFLAETGGKLILESSNRVTLTRPAQAEKITKDVSTAGVIGVEVSAYGATAKEAAASALETFQGLLKDLK